MDYSQLDLGEVRFRIRDRGPLADPAPILLLHDLGLSGRCFEHWLAQADGLERRLIAVDLPGFGGSRAGRGSPSPSEFARQLAELVAALRLARFDLVALGWAGRVAEALAARGGSSLRRALAIPGAGSDELGLPADLGPLSALSPEAARSALGARIPAECSPDTRRELRAELASVPGRWLLRVLRATDDPLAGAEGGRGLTRLPPAALGGLPLHNLATVLDLLAPDE